MIAHIAIGSNLGSPATNVEIAIKQIAALGTLCARSSFYATKPWGVVDQPDFYNAVVQIDTKLDARDLLNALKKIEISMGRTPTYKWGPRLIDLDLLTLGDLRVSEPDLIVPHPRMHERAFVLVPLAEIEEKYSVMRDKLPQEDVDGVIRLGPAATV